MQPIAPDGPRATRDGRAVRWVTLTMLVAIVSGGSGFVYKLIQFSREALTSDVASFAVVPVVTYVLVALGFSCLFVWALLRGQLTSIEAPKHRLLEDEERHDREE
jgi:hypothetical protein